MKQSTMFVSITSQLDLGVNNLVTAVSSEGRSFIIDGRKLKSVSGSTKKMKDYRILKTDRVTKKEQQTVRKS